MFPQYTVINNYTHRALRFDNARQVAVYLWGKDMTNYTVIKSKVLGVGPANISEFQAWLEQQ